CFASLRSAPSRGRKRLALRKPGRAQRWPAWLFGCLAVPPLLAAPAPGRLQGGTRVGARVLRQLTRRGCPSGARQRIASSTAHPATDTPQVCPGAQRRGRRLGVAFSLVTFSWRNKRKLLAAGRLPASALNPSMLFKPARPSFDKLNPSAQAYPPQLASLNLPAPTA